LLTKAGFRPLLILSPLVEIIPAEARQLSSITTGSNSPTSSLFL
jgi:hypothetical protein